MNKVRINLLISTTILSLLLISIGRNVLQSRLSFKDPDFFLACSMLVIWWIYEVYVFLKKGGQNEKN